nr:venom allergen-like protein [synthetic construct]
MRLSDDEKQIFVDNHNRLRRQLANGETNSKNGPMPQGANINEVTWDDDLEASAVEWAEACAYHHPSDAPYGQNLAAQWPHTNNYLTRVEKWYNESSKYSGNPHLEYSSGIGHFTQVVWADTNKIGCAVQDCSNGLSQGLGDDNWTFTVCNYDPAGNVDGEDIYQTGDPCSQCEEEEGCNDSLCSAE